eukprot:2989463-Rhodomonas_salina.1
MSGTERAYGSPRATKRSDEPCSHVPPLPGHVLSPVLTEVVQSPVLTEVDRAVLSPLTEVTCCTKSSPDISQSCCTKSSTDICRSCCAKSGTGIGYAMPGTDILT